MENEFTDFEKIHEITPPGHQFLSANFTEIGPCSRITVTAKALRVISKNCSAPVRVHDPPAGPEKYNFAQFSIDDFENFVISGHHELLAEIREFL